ncbi:MAG: ChaN family lipoprotein [Crocinitomicaceae bacterium]
MKRISILTLLLVLLNTGQAKDLLAYQIFDAKGKSVDIDKLMKATEDKSHVFFGELHNNPISHWLQFELTKRLYAKHKKRLILGGEMFEADNQYILDEYLNGQISKSSFQDEVRLWPNYNTDYKPLIEFAKEKGLTFVASNIPRRYASMVYKQNLDSLESLSDLAKSFIVPLNRFEFDSTVNCYKTMIRDFGDHGGVSIATAQAIKDATMAHFIQKYSQKKGIFLHFNGAYHSDHKEGIIHYLKNYIELDKILTITTVSQEQVSELDKKNIGLADFTICVPETMTTTH